MAFGARSSQADELFNVSRFMSARATEKASAQIHREREEEAPADGAREKRVCARDGRGASARGRRGRTGSGIDMNRARRRAPKGAARAGMRRKESLCLRRAFLERGVRRSGLQVVRSGQSEPSLVVMNPHASSEYSQSLDARRGSRAGSEHLAGAHD